MSSKISYRLLIFLAAVIFSAIFAAPSIFQTEKGSKINLGLDLQGGLHMLLEVQSDEAVVSKIKSIAASVNYAAKRDDLLMDGLKLEGDSFEFEILDADEASKFDAILHSAASGLDIQKSGEKYRVTLTPEEVEATKKYAIEQAVETIRNRLDQFGLAEPTVAKQGESYILVELPGVKSAADEQRAKDLIAKAAHLQLMAVDDVRQDRAQTISAADARAYGDVIYPDVKNPNYKYLINEIPVLDGAMLVDAKVAFDQHTNQPIINFTLNSQGAQIFGDFTGKNVGKRLAIVLDGKVYSAPRINERIGGGSGQISGGFSVEEAHDVTIALRSGALLAPVKVSETRSIGPSLGQDSIDKSMAALSLAAVAILIFMILYYGVAGLFADIALVVNILFLIACMALFGATLTLPGMAVDANVIINERVREVLRTGVSIRQSINKGYENAMSAIVDSNITTLITSAALYAYGTGPVKGFAVTMSIGIVASMITAILGTHGMFELVMDKMEKSKNTALWLGYKVRGGANASVR